MTAQSPWRPLSFATPTLYPTASPPTLRPPQATPQPTTEVASTTPSPAPSAFPSPTQEAICPMPAGWQRYQVVEGDTVYSLAEASVQTNVQELLRANCLDAVRALEPGEWFYVPVLATATPVVYRCNHPANWRQVQVRAGETLYALAVRYGTTVEALRQANCLRSDRILAGSWLWAPPYIVVPPTPVRTATRAPTPTSFPSATPEPSVTMTPHHAHADSMPTVTLNTSETPCSSHVTPVRACRLQNPRQRRPCSPTPRAMRPRCRPWRRRPTHAHRGQRHVYGSPSPPIRLARRITSTATSRLDRTRSNRWVCLQLGLTDKETARRVLCNVRPVVVTRSTARSTYRRST